MGTEKKKPEITEDQALELGITAAEWEIILSLLGRCPTEYEALVFKVIWSEEFSGIHSRNVSKFFHSEDEKYQTITGTRAAVVPLDEKISLAISCNSRLGGVVTHPGLGMQANIESLLTDLWQLGVEPVGVSASMRLGQASNVEHIKIFQSLISGSSRYLMHVGLPVAELDYFFHSKFKHQPVMNMFSLGVVESGVGAMGAVIDPSKEYVLFYVGSLTGPITRSVKKSDDLDSEAFASMVVGDPIWSSRLAGALKEAVASKKVCAVQKIEKGGLVSAVFLLAQKTERAFDLHLDRIPIVNPDMSAKEIMFSESSGRMFLITAKDHYKELHEIFDKWRFKIAVVGGVTNDYGMKINWRHSEIVDIPISRILESIPFSKYQLLNYPPMIKENPRHVVEQAEIEQVEGLEPSDVAEADDDEEDDDELKNESDLDIPVYLNDTWTDLLGSPIFADRSRLHSLFDRGVGSLLFPGFRDSCVIRINKGSGEKLIASTLVSKPLFVYNNTYLGSAHTVAEAIRNVSCVGATPLAIAACFNFGNPRNYKYLCDISEILRGAGDASRYWNVPIACEDINLTCVRTAQSITPTMCVELVGLVASREHLITCSFQKAGDIIFVLGDTKREIEATEYSYYCHQRVHGKIPDLNFEYEMVVNSLVRELVHRKLLKSSNAVGSGGLAIALAEGCLTPYPPIGAELFIDTKMSAKDFRPDALLFSETAGRFLVSCSPENATEVKKICKERGVFIGGDGVVGGRSIAFSSPITCSLSLSAAYKVWTQGIQTLFGEE